MKSFLQFVLKIIFMTLPCTLYAVSSEANTENITVNTSYVVAYRPSNRGEVKIETINNVSYQGTEVSTRNTITSSEYQGYFVK